MSIEVMKRIKSLLQDTKMIDSHTISAVVAECDMAILAKQPATPEPVAWMASYVDPVGNDHVYVTSHRDLAVENDMHGTPRPLYTRPAPSVPDDGRPYVLALSESEVKALADYHDFQQEEADTTGVGTQGDAVRAKDLRAMLAAQAQKGQG